MSPFDPATFMQTQFNEENATRGIPCPVGEYAAKVEKVDPKLTESGKALLNLSWEILDPNVLVATGKTKVLVRQTVWLDIDEATGSLAFGEGKNIQLGRLREALNQNTKGQPWQPAMLVGGSARVKVAHNPDKTTGDIYDNVVAVAKL